MLICTRPAFTLFLVALFCCSVPRSARAELPDDVRARLNSLIDGGDFPEALTLCNECVEAYPLDAECWGRRSVCLASLGRPEPALQDSEQAIRLDPDYSAGYAGKGYSLAVLGKPAEGLKYINRAIGMLKSCPGYYYDRAQILDALGKHKEAMKDYAMVMRLSKDRVDVQLALARSAYCFDKKLAYKHILTAFKKLDPKSRAHITATLLGIVILRDLGKPDQATVLLRSELKGANRYFFEYDVLKYFDHQITDEELLSKAREIDDNCNERVEIQEWYTRAWVALNLRQAGEPAKGRENYEWCLRHSPSICALKTCLLQTAFAEPEKDAVATHLKAAKPSLKSRRDPDGSQ